MIAMGLIVLASNLGLLPREFWNLWPLILIVAGLGGLLTSDRDEWMYDQQLKADAASRASHRPVAKSPTRRRK